MAISLGDNLGLGGALPVDSRYFDGSVPWVDETAAKAGISYRYSGLTINIAGTEWWWKDGVTDACLIEKTTGSGSLNMSGSTADGLTTYVDGTTICASPSLTYSNSTGALTFDVSDSCILFPNGVSKIISQDDNLELDSAANVDLRINAVTTMSVRAASIVANQSIHHCDGKDMAFYPALGDDDRGDIVWYTSGGTETHRLWTDSDTTACNFYVRFSGDSLTNRCMIHTGNIDQFTSGGIGWSGSTANAIGTYANVDGICAEPTLTYDGDILSIGADGGQKSICVQSSTTPSSLLVGAGCSTDGSTGGHLFLRAGSATATNAYAGLAYLCGGCADDFGGAVHICGGCSIVTDGGDVTIRGGTGPNSDGTVYICHGAVLKMNTTTTRVCFPAGIVASNGTTSTVISATGYAAGTGPQHTIVATNNGTGDGQYYAGYFCSYSATAEAEGRSTGVRGIAGNRTAGYNAGVIGQICGTNAGAGILGSTGEIPFGYSGLWAGYFCGNVCGTTCFIAPTMCATSTVKGAFFCSTGNAVVDVTTTTQVLCATSNVRTPTLCGATAIRAGTTTENAIVMVANGAVCLNHNNIKKLETTATGSYTTGVHCATTCVRTGVLCSTSCARLSTNLYFSQGASRIICIDQATDGLAGDNLYICAGAADDGGTYVGYKGGCAHLFAGRGSNESGDDSGDGGDVCICGGVGGTADCYYEGGDGGHVRIRGGTGGAGCATTGNQGTVYLYYGGTIRSYLVSTGAVTVGVHCSTTCSRSGVHCSTTAHRSTGTGYRFCGGTGCGTAVDWVATSDCRIKKCIEPITSALSTIDCLCGVCYELCEDDTKDMGLIAQAVLDVEPRLVAHGDVPEEYKKYGIEDEVLSLKYDKFAGLFVEAIKELKTQNECLQEQIIALRNEYGSNE